MTRFLNSNKILDYFFAFIIPIMMGGNFVLFKVGGLHFYFSLVFSLLILVLYHIFPTSNKRKSLNVIAIRFFLLWVIISIWSITSEGDKRTICFIIYTLFSLFVVTFYKNIREYEILFRSVVCGVLIVIIRILLFDETDMSTIDISSRFNVDFLGGINNAAYIVTTSIIITYYFFHNKYLRWFIIFLCIAFNIYTLSRGANLVMIIFFLYLFRKAPLWNKIVVAFICVILVSYFYQYLGDDLISRYNFLEESSSNQDNRSVVWEYALSKMTDLPELFWGHGFGSFVFNANSSDTLVSTHNQYIDFFYSLGVIGSLPFAYALFAYGRLCFKCKKKHESVFVLNMVYFVSFVLDTRLWVIQTVWLYPLLVSYTLVCYKNIRNGKSSFYSDRTTYVAKL